MWSKLHTILFFLLVISTSLMSCTENINVPEHPTPPEGHVHFKVKVPATAIPRKNTVKSGQIPPEAQINDIQVLVFEDGLYSYMRPGLNLDRSTENITFLTRLSSSSVPTEIYLIANSNSLLAANEPSVGTPIEDVKTRFNLAFTSDGINGNLALWGSYVFETGISASVQFTTEPIPLLRAVARVDVEVTPTAQSHFRLNSIRVFRASNQIQLIPNTSTSGTLVTEPSIPNNNENIIHTNTINTTSAIRSQAQVYVPESAAPSQATDATCIVVGGFYDNRATESFYRLDFDPKIAGHQLGQILRNHRYVFSINEVGNGGFPTAEDAANSSAVGMGVSLLVWDDSDHLNIYFDDNDYYALEKKEIELAGIQNLSVRISVNTSVLSYVMRFVEPVQTQWATSLNDGVFSVVQDNTTWALVFSALTDNPASGDVRTRKIEIRANDINRIFINVSQLPRMNIEWATHNVANFGEFTTELNARGLLYQWNSSSGWNDMGVRAPAGWPASAALSRSPVWEQENMPCPAGWRLPIEIEFRELLAEYPGRREDRSRNPLIGEWFGPTQEEANAASFEDPGNCLFFPYSGRRRDNGTTVADNKINGFFWGKDATINTGTNQATQIVMLRMGQEFATGVVRQNINREALAIRCVRDLSP